MEQNIQEKTAQLREALASSAEVVEYLAAKEAYTNDKDMVTKVNEYNVQRSVYDSEHTKPSPDTLLLASVKARLDTLYKDISESTTAQRMVNAEEAVNVLFGEIVNELQSLVVEHHDCGGNCSSCGGCH